MLLGQVSELTNEILSYYSERRKQSTQKGANSEDVPVIFILLAATRALEEEVQAELSYELGEKSQITTTLQTNHKDILRLADEEIQVTSELIDQS